METRTTDLIADFHARHEAWRQQRQDLARLQTDAQAAARREAAAILAAARADLSRIIVDARRALLVLSAQLHAITEAADLGVETAADGDVPGSVLQARRDLQRMLDDVHPDLEELASTVAQLTGRTAVVEPPKPPAVEPVSPEFAVVPQPSALQPRKWGLIVAPLVVAATLGAGAWWLLGFGADVGDLTPPMASIPPVPRATPAWDQPIPIDGSFIELPSDAR
jgi:hypothetical protein